MITDDKTSIASYFTSILLGVYGLTFQEWLALGGFLIALMTCLVNWYYKQKNYELAVDEKLKPQDKKGETPIYVDVKSVMNHEKTPRS